MCMCICVFSHVYSGVHSWSCMCLCRDPQLMTKVLSTFHHVHWDKVSLNWTQNQLLRIICLASLLQRSESEWLVLVIHLIFLPIYNSPADRFSWSVSLLFNWFHLDTWYILAIRKQRLFRESWQFPSLICLLVTKP